MSCCQEVLIISRAGLFSPVKKQMVEYIQETQSSCLCNMDMLKLYIL